MNETAGLHVPLFATLEPEQVLHILQGMQRRELAAGEMLAGEDEPGGSFYIILTGQIEVLKAQGTPEERRLALRGRGDFLGEASLFEWGGRRAASLRAQTPVVVLEMAHPAFEHLLRSTPDLAYEIARQVSLRQRSADNRSILELQAKNRLLNEAYTELKAAQAQVVEKEKLERELQLARQIQFSMLPQTLPAPGGWELGASLASARFVGGDLYDAIPLDEGRLGLMIGDVSDKGVPAGLFMALARSLLRAEARRHASPAAVLRQVNSNLLEMNQSGLFVTMLYGVLDIAGGQFEYARAGHELPQLFSPDGLCQSAPRGQGMPLGIFADSDLDVQTLLIPAGSLLLLNTDGASDAINPQGVRYGVPQLIETVQHRLHLPAQALCTQLLAHLQAYHAGEPQADDITLMAIRRLA